MGAGVTEWQVLAGKDREGTMQKRTSGLRGLEYHVCVLDWVDGEGTRGERGTGLSATHISSHHSWHHREGKQVFQGRSGYCGTVIGWEWLGGEGDGDSETLR